MRSTDYVNIREPWHRMLSPYWLRRSLLLTRTRHPRAVPRRCECNKHLTSLRRLTRFKGAAAFAGGFRSYVLDPCGASNVSPSHVQDAVGREHVLKVSIFPLISALTRSSIDFLFLPLSSPSFDLPKSALSDLRYSPHHGLHGLWHVDAG